MVSFSLSRKKFFSLVSFMILLFSLSSLSFAADFRRLQVKQILPDFSLQDMGGKNYSLADYKGHNALLVFWNIPETAMHRDYSLEELLMVQNFTSLYGVNKGFKALAIYVPWHDDRIEDKEIEAILSLRKKHNLNLDIAMDNGLKLFNQFGVNATPSTIIINKRGKITFTMSSYPWSSEKVLREAVETQLKVESSKNKYAKAFSKRFAGEKTQPKTKKISFAKKYQKSANGFSFFPLQPCCQEK